jgi:hypothetical protein
LDFGEVNAALAGSDGPLETNIVTT